MEHKYWMFPSALPALKPNQSLTHSTISGGVQCNGICNYDCGSPVTISWTLLPQRRGWLPHVGFTTQYPPTAPPPPPLPPDLVLMSCVVVVVSSWSHLDDARYEWTDTHKHVVEWLIATMWVCCPHRNKPSSLTPLLCPLWTTVHRISR